MYCTHCTGRLKQIRLDKYDKVLNRSEVIADCKCGEQSRFILMEEKDFFHVCWLADVMKDGAMRFGELWEKQAKKVRKR